MPFDLTGARKEGYTDKDILSYLAGRDETNVEQMFGSDEEKIAELMRRRGTKMLPVEYAPAAQPRRQMSPAEIQTLWSEQGIQPTLAPVSLLDLAMEGAGSFLDEADVSQYAIPATLLGMVMKKRAPAFNKGLTGEAVLEESARLAKAPPAEQFKAFREANPEAGRTLFDLTNPQPSVNEQFPLPRNVPARGPSERVADVMKSRKVERKMLEAAEAGMEKVPKVWYRTSPLFDRFKSEYGKSRAEQFFRQLANSISATSPRSKVPQNVKIGSYYRWKAGQPGGLTDIPPKGSGYGSIAQQTHLRNMRQILEHGGFDPLVNPKPASFSENIIGNEIPVTVDTHNFRAPAMFAEDPRFLANTMPKSQLEVENPDDIFKPGYKPQEAYYAGELSMKDALAQPGYWQSAPSKATEYGPLESWQQEKLAPKVGMTPGQFQGNVWVGAGDVTGLGSPPETLLETIAARVMYTAHVMGKSPEEVLRKYVRAEIPLAGVGAGAAMLGTQSQEPESQ